MWRRWRRWRQPWDRLGMDQHAIKHDGLVTNPHPNPQPASLSPTPHPNPKPASHSPTRIPIPNPHPNPQPIRCLVKREMLRITLNSIPSKAERYGLLTREVTRRSRFVSRDANAASNGEGLGGVICLLGGERITAILLSRWDGRQEGVAASSFHSGSHHSRSHPLCV